MFVAERDVETHIWKTVYYQVSSVHGSVVQEFFFCNPSFRLLIIFLHLHLYPGYRDAEELLPGLGEYLRREQEDSEGGAEKFLNIFKRLSNIFLQLCLLNLFEEGVDYYSQLLTDLATTYRSVTAQQKIFTNH